MADLIHLSSPSSSKLFSLTSCLSNSLASQRSGRGRAASVSLPASAFSRSSSGSRLRLSKVHATSNIAETKQPKWWEKSGGPNMMDIHSTQEFFSTLNQAGDRLVIVKFYATWCTSCKALLPKLCRTAEEHPEILFLKVNFDENKPMCKSLNVRVLPYFHLYRGAHGQLESFSCSLAKFKKLRDAIALHNTSGFTIGPPKKTGELTLESLSAPISNSPAESN